MGSWIQNSNFVLLLSMDSLRGEIEKQSGQYLGLICDESLTCRCLNSNPGHFCDSTLLPLSLVRVENHICLFYGVQVAGATWEAVIRIMVGVGDLM
jgi:hypothetical protein